MNGQVPSVPLTAAQMAGTGLWQYNAQLPADNRAGAGEIPGGWTVTVRGLRDSNSQSFDVIAQLLEGYAYGPNFAFFHPEVRINGHRSGNLLYANGRTAW